MLLLKPGQRVNLRHKEKDTYLSGTILAVEGQRLTLSLEGSLSLERGDWLKLDVVQQQDALYIIDGRVLDVDPEQNLTLEFMGEPHRLQRRQSQRIPARLQAQYLILEDELEYRPGMVMDISRGGALLSVQEPLSLLSDLLLFFDIFTGKGDLLTTGVSGRVVREHVSSKERVYSYGIEFDKPLNLLAG